MSSSDVHIMCLKVLDYFLTLACLMSFSFMLGLFCMLPTFIYQVLQKGAEPVRGSPQNATYISSSLSPWGAPQRSMGMQIRLPGGQWKLPVCTMLLAIELQQHSSSCSCSSSCSSRFETWPAPQNLIGRNSCNCSCSSRCSGCCSSSCPSKIRFVRRLSSKKPHSYNGNPYLRR